MERLTHQLFFWSEMVGNLASLDLYVFSMASKEVSMSFHEHVVFKNLVFKVEDLARRRAWSILRMIHSPQKLDSSSVRQVELIANHNGAYKILTTAADWAARKGHLELLEYLIVIAGDSCTEYAMSWAARNGHMDVLVFLKESVDCNCTDTAANWAAARGQDRVLKWLYKNTQSRCCELAPMNAAGMGFMRVLVFLHENHPTCFRDTAANYALDNGHVKISAWLNSIGCHPTPSREIRKSTMKFTTLYDRWD